MCCGLIFDLGEVGEGREIKSHEAAGLFSRGMLTYLEGGEE